MVSTSSGIRLVKCPKCHNLLPELPNIPVYSCGGCGAILRAKVRVTDRESKVSVDSSEMGLTLSDSKDSLLFDSVEQNTEKIQSSTDVSSEQLKNESKERNSSDENLKLSDRSKDSLDSTRIEKAESENSKKEEILGEITISGDLNLPDSKEKKEGNGEKQLEKNDASVIRVNSNLGERSTEHETHERKVTGAGLVDFHSARNFSDLKNEKSLTNIPKNSDIYRNVARTQIGAKSYEVLQADVLSKVDRLRHELIELFAKPNKEKSNPNLQPPNPQQNRYRHVRNTFNPSMVMSRENRIKQVASSSEHLSHGNCYNSHNFHLHIHQDRKQHLPKNHCRPILGGSPFVVCSHCLNLVQLPADFTVSRRRLRSLRCGRCSKVLLYSYRQHPSNTNPQTPNYTDTFNTPYNHNFLRGDPISISEEYRVSFGRSYSTELERPLHVSRNSSFSQSEDSNSRRVIGSRLHQIMGYDSASELLRKSSDLSDAINGISVRDIKGKGICVNERDENSPRKSRIQGLFKKKGVVKFKPT